MRVNGATAVRVPRGACRRHRGGDRRARAPRCFPSLSLLASRAGTTMDEAFDQEETR